ncbi:subtype I-C CRISPR-associated endonuclease Cas1 [candidate division KSB3 bacterium]|uniref:CRISPR-associated endonuclease Cas1 n=1 Tax=candidate division KSB3 bacterium TaxID=2044937 RepID=A0A2G6E234_9BACT|nr:MAG: subtype I-C CRISPR-associated endonuclease Cas1 [candidate division KSB3 bacterium]PIE29952.1 MAG: subtype I-C CRISPR-associated endonuclease Cas1 [candidate division KSB3 bacterium]
MKRLLNTLYVTTNGAYIHRDHDTLVIEIKSLELKKKLPVLALNGLVAIGRVMMSPDAMALCAERGITVSFLTEHNRFLASVLGAQSGNVLLRRAQYRITDDTQACREIVRCIVAAKVSNTRAILQRTLRNHPDNDKDGMLAAAVKRLARIKKSIAEADSADSIRGYEGEAAREYFSVFPHLLNSDSGFKMDGRNRRPPRDPVNALLSFAYTLLSHDCRGACEAVGLDPAVGFLHRDRPGRPGCALDLMEEFRAFVADRVVLRLINRKQIKPTQFQTQDSGAVRMTEDCRKTLLENWQKRKQEEITHPLLNEKMPLGLAFHVQAQLLARHLRGDSEFYPASLWK